MIVRSVKLAFVSSVLFAALGASPGPSVAASSASSLTQDAYAALSGGNPAKSIGLYSQAIDSHELGPEALANALFNRALAYQNTGASDKAVDDYSAALDLDAMPSGLRARVLYNRGLAYQQGQKATLAIEDFTSALLINSSFAEAYLARGNALRDNGQYLFSISDYERALKYKHPQAARVYFGEAQAYELLRRPAEATHLLKQALETDSSFTPAREKLAALGQVAQNDDAVSDPIITASTGVNPIAATEMKKDVLPKGVEPPAALVAAAADVAQPEAPAAALIADAKANLSKVAEQAADEPVVVAEVPKIPAQAQKPVGMAKSVAKPVATKDAVDAIETASTDPAPAPAASGWVVQISSAGSEDAAWSSFKSMQKSHKVLGGLKPAVVKADLGAKGTFYRVRLQGFDDQQAAQSACGKLKAGGIACFVSKAVAG